MAAPASPKSFTTPKWGVWCNAPSGAASGWLYGPEGTRDEFTSKAHASQAAVMAQRSATQPGWRYEPRRITDE
jgi:hypothetical protein